jgi:hypothetical protein
MGLPCQTPVREPNTETRSNACSRQLGQFYEGNVTPNMPATYTMPACSLRRNQLCENMMLVLNHFCWNLNAKMALPSLLPVLDEI